ncbi:MAG TPA: hypothetical protein VHL54_06450 [Actinomycetota bacterium]|nr:hypothetical protein [Actinomycetota bacterium]
MKHISEGGLRRMLDQPQTFPPEQRAHLESCERCRDLAAVIVADAGRAAQLVEGTGKISVDLQAALEALRAKGVGPLSASTKAPARRLGVLRSGRALRPLLGVALVAVMGLTLVGTGVAGNLIKIFEPDQVVAVPVDLETLNSLPDLTRYGNLALTQEPEAATAASLAEAAERTGLDLLAPANPPTGVGAERIRVLTTGTASFTFDAAKATSESGEPLPALPAAIDGSSLFLQAGPAVIQVFGGAIPGEGDPAVTGDAPSEGDLTGLLSSLPDLMIVQMKAPVLSSNGPSVADYRDALLALPNLSPTLKAQIEGIGDPSSTLPLPIPVDFASSEEVDVNGVTGLVVGDNTGVGSGVVWQSGGMVRAVGGTMTQDQVLQVARSMR